MNGSLLAALDAEIRVRQDQLAALVAARDLLDEAPAQPKPAKVKKTAPKKSKRKQAAKAESGSTEPDDFGENLNGVFVRMTENESRVFDVLNQAPDGEFVLGPAVQKHTGLNAVAVRGVVVTLRGKLEAQAKATIEAVRGKGYRLNNL